MSIKQSIVGLHLTKLMQVTLPYPDKSLGKGKYKGTDPLMRLEKCVSMKIEKDHKLDDCPE
jgi:hypothetical protein